jgi:pimeloyl-ACP methyl ester carboxylesterase
MPDVTSKDGTKIGYSKTGQGPALILTGGAFQDRSGLAAHAALLSAHFTVYNYDRRGRGESGDNPPYAVEREIEDIDALIQAAGGSAFLFGGSSGAVLALDAAACGLSIPKLALYEPPFVVDDTRKPVPEHFVEQLKEMIAAGRRGDAAEAFMLQGANTPVEMVVGMRNAPFWPAVETVAHTLIYDAMIMDGSMAGKALPANRLAGVTMPTLVMDGGNSPAWARNAVQALVRSLPNAKHRTLQGQEHGVTAEALAPILEEFFTA